MIYEKKSFLWQIPICRTELKGKSDKLMNKYRLGLSYCYDVGFVLQRLLASKLVNENSIWPMSDACVLV